MQCVLLGGVEKRRERILQQRDLFVSNGREQFCFNARGHAQRILNPFMSGAREPNAQNAPLFRMRLAFHQPLSLERTDNLDDGLRSHSDFPSHLRGAGIVRTAQPMQHEKLRRCQVELRQCRFDARTYRELCTL